MTMQYLIARRYPRRMTLTVHLDTTRTVPDPENVGQTIPDPTWTMSQTWPLPARGTGESAGAYTTRLVAWATGTKTDFQTACAARLAELQDATDPGTALPFEGTTF